MHPRQLLCFGLFIALLFVQSARTQMTLTEIMFNPAGNERYDEFIELFNLSAVDTVDLQDWIVSDGSGWNCLRSSGMGTRLPPRHHALVLLPGYATNSILYQNLIPPNTLRLTIDAAQFGSYGLNNSRSETVSLYTPDSIMVSSWSYTVPNEEGISEEKIHYDLGDAAENWTHGAAVHGTPGSRNSASPCSYDLALQEVTIYSSCQTTADSICLGATVINRGGEAVSAFWLQTFRILDCAVPDELGPVLATHPHQRVLPPGDSIRCLWTCPRPDVMMYCLVVEVVAAADENHGNDRFFVRATLPLGHGPLLINEIMYNTEEKSQEWIELFNPDTLAVDLRQWQLCDLQKKVTLATQSWLVPPLGYAVAANAALADSLENVLVNSALPEWNNSGDEIRLLDAQGLCRDSLVYSAQWGGGRFVTLERKRWRAPSCASSNWASCRATAGATPGRYNSVSPLTVDVALVAGSLVIEPVQLIENQPARISCELENSGLADLESVRIDFYYMAAQDSSFIKQLEIAGLASAERRTITAEWPRVAAGACTVCVEAVVQDDAWLENNKVCLPVLSGYEAPMVIVNELMILPASGAAEWIEFYNRGVAPVDLSGWHFCDADSSRMRPIMLPQALLPPAGYLLLSPDQDWLSQNLPQEALGALVLDWPSLSSDEDALSLFDGSHQRVESLRWDCAWTIERGKSLERLSPLIAAAERSNWGSSVDAAGHTAGRKNSLFHQALPAEAAFAVAPNPFSPDGDGYEDHLAISYLLPVKTARINLRIFDTLGRQVRFLCNYEPSGSGRTLFWDGLDEEGRRCRIGPYILYLEAFDETSGRLLQLKKVCVLAGQL